MRQKAIHVYGHGDSFVCRSCRSADDTVVSKDGPLPCRNGRWSKKCSGGEVSGVLPVSNKRVHNGQGDNLSFGGQPSTIAVVPGSGDKKSAMIAHAQGRTWGHGCCWLLEVTL